MYGWGVMKTLAIAVRHFVLTYVDDFKYGFKRYTPKNLAQRQGPDGRGIYTVQYPEERLPLPERSRNQPFFVIDAQTEQMRCTACGLCAQMCPSQCIWIERAQDPETGRPRRYPVKYTIDISMCMGCGYCAEFCPFDAIKMDSVYELASYTRPGFADAMDMAKPESYHAAIHPTDYAAEQAKKAAK
ncbi:MAG: 4Fe-4S dicluster domain-containing protein [Anaerolineales bacterium]|nr:MAG: 4Fe-4S dicluster domain-containing protein [Anaerolineales bacterium]